MAVLHWEIKSFDALTKEELYEILKLRFEVFVVEQKCTDLDLDDRDQESIHMFLRENNHMIACLRMLPEGLSYPEASIGRFAVDREFRKQGIGRKGLETAIRYILEEWKESAIRISGQAYLYDFYRSFGFQETKGPYLEDQIPHYQFLLKREDAVFLQGS